MSSIPASLAIDLEDSWLLEFVMSRGQVLTKKCTQAQEVYGARCVSRWRFQINDDLNFVVPKDSFRLRRMLTPFGRAEEPRHISAGSSAIEDGVKQTVQAGRRALGESGELHAGENVPRYRQVSMYVPPFATFGLIASSSTG